MSITSTLVKPFQILLATLIAFIAIAVPGHASAAGVSASPNPAPAGSTVTVTGSAFVGGEAVEINYAGDIVTTPADSNGNIQTPFTIDPTVLTGGHPLEANGDSGSWADGTLTVSAPIRLHPPSSHQKNRDE